MATASAALVSASMALFLQSRSTASWPGPVSRNFQALSVGLKSIQGRYFGPWKTAMGCLNEVISSQYRGNRATIAQAMSRI